MITHKFSKKQDSKKDKIESSNKHSNSVSTYLDDNRPEAVAQQKLQDINNRFASHLNSNPVTQLVSAVSVYGKPISDMHRQELRNTMDNATIDESDKVAAEGELRNQDQFWIRNIKAMVEANKLTKALAYATHLSGLNPNHYLVKPTSNYAKVVEPASDIPRGKPSGVTVEKDGLSIIYIHKDNIKNWVLNGNIGDLLSTIRHEAKHADQNRAGMAHDKVDEREFGAYYQEIMSAYELFRYGEDSLAPSWGHLTESYSKAMGHFSDLSLLDKIRLNPKVQELDEIFPRLKKFLAFNDKDSGRVEREARSIKASLRSYIDGKTKEYPSMAYTRFVKIPEEYRKKLEPEILPLIDAADEKNRKEWIDRK